MSRRCGPTGRRAVWNHGCSLAAPGVHPRRRCGRRRQCRGRPPDRPTPGRCQPRHPGPVLEASDHRILPWLAGSQRSCFLTAFGFLIAWTNRAYRNLQRSVPMTCGSRDGWAVGGWFVPFLNFVRPKQIMNDVWRGSSPDGLRRGRLARAVGHAAAPLVVGPLDRGRAALVPSFSGHRRTRPPRNRRPSLVHGRWLYTILARPSPSSSSPASPSARSSGPPGSRAQVVRPAVGARGLARHRPWPWPSSALAFAGFAASRQRARPTGSSSPMRLAASRNRRVDRVIALDLALGDCFDDPPGWSDTTEEVTEVLAVNVVPCTESHDEEVVGVSSGYPAGVDAPFPGDDALTSTRRQSASSAFERWVGRSLSRVLARAGLPLAPGRRLGLRRPHDPLPRLPAGRPAARSSTVRDSAM